MAKADFICKRCGGRGQYEPVPAVNCATSPELKEKLLSGELFIRECPHCGARNLVTFPLLYHDPQEHLMIWLSDGQAATEQRMREAVEAEEFAPYT